VRIREQHPATVVRAGLRCLSRQSQARRPGQKGAVTSACNAGPTKVGRRRHGWCRSAYAKSDLYGAGFRMVEGTPAFGTASPFAGRRQSERLGQPMRTKGISSPPNERLTTHKGYSSNSDEVGNLRLRPTAAAVAIGGNLRSGLFGPCSPALSSNGHRRKRWSGRGAARKRRSDRSMAFEVVFAALLQRRESGFGRAVAARGSRDSSSRGEGRYAVRSVARARARSKSLRHAALRDFARIGCSWVCSYVEVVAEVVGRQSGPEKRVSAFRMKTTECGDAQGRGSSAR